MQLDPGIKQLLLRRAGVTSSEEVPAAFADEEIAVVAKLADPTLAVASFQPIARFGSIVTGRIPLGAVEPIRRDPNVLTLKASRALGTSAEDDVEPAAGVDVVFAPWVDTAAATTGGRGVVVAVIDWGCDFVHANFRNADGSTRLRALWDQRGGPSDRSPAPFGYGRQLDGGDIDAALAAPDPYLALDYDPFRIDPRGLGTHGTHVLDIAAGNGRAPGAAAGIAPEADLLFVHLRGMDTLPTDTLGDSVSLLEATRWVVDQAGDRPLVVSLSMGRHCGPHDGTTPLEEAIDTLLEERAGLAFVMSTGNYFDARVHSAGRLATSETTELTWDVLPHNDETSELEVWYAGRDRFSVELLDPSGRSHGPVALGEERVVREGDAIVASLFHRADNPGNHDNHIELFVWPDAPVGRWTVRLRGEEVHDGHFDSWIERDDVGSQSRFPVEQAVRRSTTNTICNGRRPIVVGACTFAGEDRVLLPFSSSGPTRDGRTKPDFVAPGGSIRAARSSRIVDGVRTRDETTVKSGTSMAAPHVAGIIARMFEAAGDARLGIEEVRALLRQSAQPVRLDDDLDGERSGAGAPLAAAAVEAARALAARPEATAAPLEPAPESPPRSHEAALEAFTGLARALPSLRALRGPFQSNPR